MQDISEILKFQMAKQNCSSLCAFLIVTEEEKDVRVLQSKSIEKVSRRLCDQSDKQSNKR